MSPSTHVLTLVAGEAGALSPRLVARMREAAAGGAPATLAPGLAVDIPVAAPPDLDRLRHVLDGAAIDLLTTEAAGRRRKLLVADMDSTIITGETLDELAALAGTGERVAAITRRSMNGELDFALVATMRRHGARCALVSGGFTFFTDRVARLCGFDAAFANVLRDDGAVLTGTVVEPVLDRGAKLAIMCRLAAGLQPGETLAVGDGANDLDMLRGAGLGIAFRPKPVLAAAVANRVEHADLRALLFAQGFRGDEIED